MSEPHTRILLTGNNAGADLDGPSAANPVIIYDVDMDAEVPAELPVHADKELLDAVAEYIPVAKQMLLDGIGLGKGWTHRPATPDQQDECRRARHPNVATPVPGTSATSSRNSRVAAAGADGVPYNSLLRAYAKADSTVLALFDVAMQICIAAKLMFRVPHITNIKRVL